jgi:hypothetical protein
MESQTSRPADRHRFGNLSVLLLVLLLEKGHLMTEPIFDHDRVDVYRLSIDYVASSFAIAKDLNACYRHARD